MYCDLHNLEPPQSNDYPVRSHQTSQRSDQTSDATLQLDASMVLSQLSTLYPHVLAGTTRFIPQLEHNGRLFTAVKTRRPAEKQESPTVT
jgi:hypothetical protein